MTGSFTMSSLIRVEGSETYAPLEDGEKKMTGGNTYAKKHQGV